jgi:hypothetical protein
VVELFLGLKLHCLRGQKTEHIQRWLCS